MTGWRLGFVVGNPIAVNAVKTVKDNIDNGSLRSLQFAGAKATLNRGRNHACNKCDLSKTPRYSSRRTHKEWVGN